MKKIFSFLSVCIACMALTSATLKLDSGLDEIKAEVAAAYGVSTSQVALISPDMVRVNVSPGPVWGTASFVDCAGVCTDVTIVFPTQTLNFIVEDDLTQVAAS